MLNRVYNFSSGPAVLPEAVLLKAQEEMLNYCGSGMSVMEMSHRSKVYEEIIYGTEKLFRELMNIPSNYKVLFLQGGASTQFAAIPLNIGNKSGLVDIIGTGMWTNRAEAEARKFCAVNVVATSKDKTFTYIPETKREDFSPNADYVHICWNNTIYGTKYTDIPDDYWAAEEIEDVVTKNIISVFGDNTYRPLEKVTRVDWTGMLLRALGLAQAPITSEPNYSDVTRDTFGFEHIARSDQFGLIYGYTDGEFKPQRFITKVETASIMSHITKDTDVNSEIIKQFADYQEVPNWGVLPFSKAIKSFGNLKTFN